MAASTQIRELVTEAEWIEAFPVVSQLRNHLDEAAYLDYLERMTANGYRLFGLFADGDLAAVAGVDILTNMYYGRHLWVFDLVTDADHRSKGFGERLLRYLEGWAADRGCEKIALSSGLQRDAAHRFYEERADMDRVSYVFTTDLD
jgi:GNAT superfamily N-acetyltransferase